MGYTVWLRGSRKWSDAIHIASVQRGPAIWPSLPNSLLFAALGRAWQWLTLVHTDDPVRSVLNRGFAAVIVVLTLIGPLLAPADHQQ